MTSVRAGSNNASAQGTARSRGLRHVHPDSVSLQTVLDALGDPVRRTILHDLARHPDWTKACGTFDLPVSKQTRSHHFAVLREAGLIEQRDDGRRRLNRLRRPEFEAAFPGLLHLVDREDLATQAEGSPPTR